MEQTRELIEMRMKLLGWCLKEANAHYRELRKLLKEATQEKVKLE